MKCVFFLLELFHIKYKLTFFFNRIKFLIYFFLFPGRQNFPPLMVLEHLQKCYLCFNSCLEECNCVWEHCFRGYWYMQKNSGRGSILYDTLGRMDHEWAMSSRVTGCSWSVGLFPQLSLTSRI